MFFDCFTISTLSNVEVVHAAPFFISFCLYVLTSVTGFVRWSHFSRVKRSFCRVIDSPSELIARYMAVSSAKSLTLGLTWSGTSFMYARKSMGQRTEPSGTPEDTYILSDLTPFKTTA